VFRSNLPVSVRLRPLPLLLRLLPLRLLPLLLLRLRLLLRLLLLRLLRLLLRRLLLPLPTPQLQKEKNNV